MPLAGLLPRWFLVIWWVCHVYSSGVGAKSLLETKAIQGGCLRQRQHKEGVWSGEGWAKCLETDHNSQLSKMPHSSFSLWTLHGFNSAETSGSSLQLLPPCVLQLSWGRAPWNSAELKERVYLDCISVIALFPPTDLSWLLPPVSGCVSLIHPSRRSVLRKGCHSRWLTKGRAFVL